MEIKRGDKLTLKDLAVFFNISYSTIKHTKEKRLQLFNSFCDYHLEGKKIVIDEVIFSTYEKYQIDAYRILSYLYNRLSDAEKQEQLDIDERDEINYRMNSFLGMASILKEIYSKDYGLLSDRSIITKVKRVADKYFGTTINPKKEYTFKELIEITEGIYGIKNYVWAIKLEGKNEYRALSEDERKLFNKCLKNYFFPQSEEEMSDFSNYLLDLFGLPEVVDLNKVNGKDVYSALIEKYKSKFKNIIDIFKKETGYIIVRTTEYNLKRGIMLVDIKKDIEALRKGLTKINEL